MAAARALGTPPGSKLFDAIYPLRSLVAGENRRIDDHLPLGCARSYGARRILLDLFAHGHPVNSYGRSLYGPRGARRHEVPELAGREAA